MTVCSSAVIDHSVEVTRHVYVVSVSLAFRTNNSAINVFTFPNGTTAPTLKSSPVVIVVVSCFHVTVGAVVTPDMVQVMGTSVVPLSTSAPVVVTPEVSN